MKDEDKTKEQLINELVEMRQRITELEKSEKQRKRAVEALRESRNFVQTIINGIGDPTLALDPINYRIVMANKATQDQFGGGDPVAILTCYQASHNRDGPCDELDELCPLKQVIATKAPVRVTHTHLDVDSNESFIDIIATPVFDKDGKVVQIIELFRDITERKQAERALQICYHFLKIANRHTEMMPLLKEFMAEVKNFTGCAAVGLCILDEESNITHQAYEGFSQEFYKSENPLSIKSNQCMCTNVIRGETEPKLPFYTEGGSFYMNSTTRFLATVSEEEDRQPRIVCNKFGYESVALVPIRLGDHILGLIYVVDPKENMVPLEMVEMMEMTAIQLGTAIQRVRAGEELRKYREHLEELVEERTAELTKSNRQLQQEITERKKAEEELKSSREQLRNLSIHLQSVREEERTHIAREIHDELGQTLTVLKMDLSWLSKRLPNVQKSLLEKTKSMSKLIDTSIQTVRRISADLRPGILDDLGIAAAIEWQAEEFQNRTGIKCEVTLNLEDIILDEEHSTAIFRILQETLTNVVRHANATKVKVSLEEKTGKLVLKVIDNGKGITEKQISDSKSLGLIGIRERLHFLNGEVKISGIPDKGTTVTVWIPLNKKEKLNAKNTHR